MSALIRAARSRLLAHRPFLLRILSMHSHPSPPLPPLPHFQSYVQPISHSRFPVRSLIVRDHSTAHQDRSGDAVSLGGELELQGSLVDEDVGSALVDVPQGEPVGKESLVDELRDGKDSVAAARINDPESENWRLEETGMKQCTDPENEDEPEEEGDELEDQEEEEELGSPISEEEEEEEGELGSPISEDDDTGTGSTDTADDLEEPCEDDEDFESPEFELACVEDVELLTLEEVKEVLQNVRARDVQIFPVHDRCEWTDLMVVGTGISDRHVRGIADALVFKIKKKPHIDPRLYPIVEGHAGGKWLVVDCGNMVIHVLDEESRAYYKLEDLWTSDVKPATADQDLERMLKTAGLKEVKH